MAPPQVYVLVFIAAVFVPPLVISWLMSEERRAAMTPPVDFRLVGYLPSYRHRAVDLAEGSLARRHLSAIVLFSMRMEAHRLVSDFDLDHFQRHDLLPSSSSSRPAVDVLVAIGGAGHSQGLAEGFNPASRAFLVPGLIETFEKYTFLDGLEINWQFPTTPQDFSNLRESVRRLRAWGARQRRKMIVTMSFPPSMDYLTRVVPRDFLVDREVLDAVNVMYYLNGVRGDLKTFRAFIENLLQRLGREGKDGVGGLSPQRITIGIPFYGQDSKTGETFSYEDAVLGSRPAEASRERKPRRSKSDYEDAEFIIAKVKMLRDEFHVGGVSIWELGQDCRPRALEGGKHAATCPREEDSLLYRMGEALRLSGVR